MKLSPNELEAFWHAIGSSDACPCCSNRTWILPVKGEGVIENAEDQIDLLESSIALRTAGVKFPSVDVSVLHFICEQCGFVRTHSTFPLLKFLETTRGQG